MPDDLSLAGSSAQIQIADQTKRGLLVIAEDDGRSDLVQVRSIADSHRSETDLVRRNAKLTVPEY